MLLSTFLDLGVAMCKQTVPQEFLERQLMKQIANMAIMRQYPIGLKYAKWFYQSLYHFTGTGPSGVGSIAKPPNCAKVLSITLIDARAGTTTPLIGATPVDNPQWVGVLNNSIQIGTLSNPKFRIDKLEIIMSPAANATNVPWDGFFHYLRNFGYIDDEGFELSDPNANAPVVLPWWQLEDALMEFVKQVKLRAKGFQDVPSAIAAMAAEYNATTKLLREADDPMAIYALNLPGTAS